MADTWMGRRIHTSCMPKTWQVVCVILEMLSTLLNCCLHRYWDKANDKLCPCSTAQQMKLVSNECDTLVEFIFSPSTLERVHSPHARLHPLPLGHVAKPSNQHCELKLCLLQLLRLHHGVLILQGDEHLVCSLGWWGTSWVASSFTELSGMAASHPRLQ